MAIQQGVGDSGPGHETGQRGKEPGSDGQQVIGEAGTGEAVFNTSPEEDVGPQCLECPEDSDEVGRIETAGASDGSGLGEVPIDKLTEALNQLMEQADIYASEASEHGMKGPTAIIARGEVALSALRYATVVMMAQQGRL